MTSKLGLLPALLPDDKTDEDLKLDKGFEWGAKDITGTGFIYTFVALLTTRFSPLDYRTKHISSCIKSARFNY